MTQKEQILDRRVRRTRRLLGEALINLLAERPWAEITIRDITEQADVAYSTFFRNFQSVEELLFTHLTEYVTEIQQAVSIPAGEGLRAQLQASVSAMFEYVVAHQKTPRVMFTTPAAAPVVAQLQGYLVEMNLSFVRPWLPHLRPDLPPLPLVMDNAATQMLGLLRWWLAQENPPNVAVMVGYYEQLLAEPLWRLLLGEERFQDVWEQ